MGFDKSKIKKDGHLTSQLDYTFREHGFYIIQYLSDCNETCYALGHKDKDINISFWYNSVYIMEEFIRGMNAAAEIFEKIYKDKSDNDYHQFIDGTGTGPYVYDGTGPYIDEE